MKENQSGLPKPSPMLRFLNLFCWCGSILGRFGIGVVIMAVLVAIFYQEENWRGRRTWARAQAEAEARGRIVDWAKLIPPPVPDDQNFFSAPHMQQWFTGRGTRDLSQRLSFQNFETWLKQPNTTVAEVTIVPPDKEIAPGEADIVLSYHAGTVAISECAEKVSIIKPSAEVIPLIVMDSVPLSDAIKNLAHAANLNYAVDPMIRFGEYLPNGNWKPVPPVSGRWTNQTAFSVLKTLLMTNDLALRPSETGMALVVPLEKAPAAWTNIDQFVKTEIAQNPNGVLTNVIPLVVMDEVPLTEAIKHLAKEAKISCRLDPKINYGQPGLDGTVHPQPTVSLRWTNITAVDALDAILANYNLFRVTDPQLGIARICIKDPRDGFVRPELAAQLKKLFINAFQSVTNGENGTHLTAALGFELSARPCGATRPVRIAVRSGTVPYSVEVKEFFPKHPLGESYPWNSETEARNIGSNTFEIYLDTPPYVFAADFLAWSDQFQDDFDAIREASKRPYAQIEGDYSAPFASPIPNFITLRVVGQTLAERAQCDLLLGHPEKAVRELRLLRDTCRMLEGRPTGKPMTLISAMINTALTGLYVQTIADGWKLHAWHEPELVELEKQLEEIDLPPYLASALDCERIATCRTLETATAEKWKKIGTGFNGSDETPTMMQLLKDPGCRLLMFAPRGWVYQNMALITRLHLNGIGGVDVANGLIVPHKADEAWRVVDAEFKTTTPFNLLAANVLPNFSHASATTARDQTLVNEARIVCALERYHLAHGEYPANLGALAPQFFDRVPRDIIDGQPLKYHRDGDKFTLYSIGWNERDDGGVSALKSDGSGDLTQADWVWCLAEGSTK